MTSPFLKDRDRIFENAVGFVIYDKFPVNKGHCLIIPKREYADYFDSTKEEAFCCSVQLTKHPETGGCI